MKFCNAAILARHAREEGYAAPAFNTNGATYEITRAAIEAAEELRAPLVLQTYQPNLAYRGCEYFVLQATHLARNATIPIALHLDHATDIPSILQAVRAGYTSVMIDGSRLPLEENVRLTRQVVELLHPLGLSVEAEVGPVGSEQEECATTNPDEAVHLVEETQVDLLAIANGTRHGLFAVQDQVDLALVRTLRQKVPVPLVQHGTCGVPLSLASALAKSGMAKMNYGEPFRVAFITYFKELSQSMDHQGHPWKILQACKDRLKEDMKEIIRAIGAEGKADALLGGLGGTSV